MYRRLSTVCCSAGVVLFSLACQSLRLNSGFWAVSVRLWPPVVCRLLLRRLSAAFLIGVESCRAVRCFSAICLRAATAVVVFACCHMCVLSVLLVERVVWGDVLWVPALFYLAGAFFVVCSFPQGLLDFVLQQGDERIGVND